MQHDRLSATTQRDYDALKVSDAIRFLACLVMQAGDPHAAAKQFALKFPNSPHVSLVERDAGRGLLGKAMVPGMTTPPGGWDANMPGALAVAFAAYVNAFTLIGRFGRNGVPPLQRAPFDRPVIVGTRSGSGVAFVQAGHAKPAKAKVLARLLLHRSKVAMVAVFEQELVRLGATGTVEFLRDELTLELAPGLDRLFVDPALAATDDSPASITNGVAPLTATGDASADLRALISAFVAGGGSLAAAVLLISSENAAALSLSTGLDGAPRFPGLTVSGGILGGLPTLASDAVGARLILVDTSRVFVADDGEADVSMASQATIELDDAPTNAIAAGSPVAPVAANLVSLWQTNSIGIRAERMMRWETVSGAVAWTQDADYLAAGSPA